MKEKGTPDSSPSFMNGFSDKGSVVIYEMLLREFEEPTLCCAGQFMEGDGAAVAVPGLFARAAQGPLPRQVCRLSSWHPLVW